VVDCSSFSSDSSLIHARGAATEKTLLQIRQRVCSTIRLSDNETLSADRAGTSAIDVSKQEMYTGVCSRGDMWTSNAQLTVVLKFVKL